MTDVADRQWGHSLVRAPTAKAAADPVAAAPLLGRVASGLAGTAELVSSVAPPPEAQPRPPAATALVPTVPAVATVPVAPPPPAPPSMVPSVRRVPTVAPSPAEPAPAAILQWPVTRPGLTLPEPVAEPVADPSLARVARGVQDCARALASLADRVDGLERRLDGVAPVPATRTPGLSDPSRSRPGGPGADADLDVRVRALEGMAADRLLTLDHRLRRLESLPAAVGRLQQDTAMLIGLARASDTAALGPPGAAPDLAHVYEELDAVAELVGSHHSAATQSLERVRTLERAVLEMRRHLERNLAEHTRAATSDQSASRSRVDALEARLAAVELSLRTDAQ